MDSGAEFSISLDVESTADSRLVRMRAMEKAVEVAEDARQAYMDGVRLVMHLAEHAAGLHRARERVTKDGYIVERSKAITAAVAAVLASEHNTTGASSRSVHGGASVTSTSSATPAEKQAKQAAQDERIGPDEVDYHMVLEAIGRYGGGGYGVGMGWVWGGYGVGMGWVWGGYGVGMGWVWLM